MDSNISLQGNCRAQLLVIDMSLLGRFFIQITEACIWPHATGKRNLYFVINDVKREAIYAESFGLFLTAIVG